MIGIGFFILFVIAVGESLTIIQIRYNMSQLSQQTINYENENKVLNEKIQEMNSDQYIQKMASLKLGMVMGNQMPVKIVVQPPVQQKNIQLGEQGKIGIMLKIWYEDLNKIILNK